MAYMNYEASRRNVGFNLVFEYFINLNIAFIRAGWQNQEIYTCRYLTCHYLRRGAMSSSHNHDVLAGSR